MSVRSATDKQILSISREPDKDESKQDTVAGVFSRAVSPAFSQTSQERTGARSLISPPPAGYTPAASPTNSENSTTWTDPDGLLLQKPGDIFEADPGNARETFDTWGYSATDAEWEEIIQKGSTGQHGGLESSSANLAVAKLAMKQLNPALFWLSVHHLNEEDLQDLKRCVNAFSALLNSVES